MKEEEVHSPMKHDHNVSSLREMSQEKKMESSSSQQEKAFVETDRD